MKTALIALAALLAVAEAAPRARPIKNRYTLCDPVLNWCARGDQCVPTKLGQGGSSGTTTTYSAGTWEANWYDRCAPCGYQDQTGQEIVSGAMTISSDPSYQKAGTAVDWTSSLNMFSTKKCPLPRVNLDAFKVPAKKSTGFSCTSTDFKKLAIGTWEMVTLNFQLVNELVIVIIPPGDVKQIMVNLKKGFNAGPGAIGFAMSAGYYVAEEIAIGDILCEIAGYFYVVTNIFSEVANFADTETVDPDAQE